MLKRPESELQIARSRDPLPTVEVDLDCIPEELHGYGELVTKAMSTIAAKYPKLKATIYVYQGPSINFRRQTLRLPLNFGALSPGFMRRSCAEPPASVARIAWG